MSKSADYDVIVIGGGGAGMSAAIRAVQVGARVLLLEAGERLGGSTALSGGVFYAPGTPLQRECGHHGDTPEAMYRHFMAVNHWLAEPALARVLCEQSLPALEWLMHLGVRFPADRLYASCMSGVPRGHQAAGYGKDIADRLEEHLRGVEVVCRTRVQQLLQDQQGAVRGITVDGRRVTSRAVVIASGSFARNQALLQQYYPTSMRQSDRPIPLSGEHSHGDGILMGKQVGAAIQGYDRGLLCSNPIYSQQIEFSRPGWLVFVNREGRRFIDESLTYMGFNAILSQTGSSCFAVFDEAARLQSAAHVGDAFAAHLRTDNWAAETIERLAREGQVIRRDTLEQLAEACGILRPKALVNTLDRYNRDARAGLDGMFFKAAQLMRPVSQPPFYAVQMRCSVVALTFTGLRIDRDAQVISDDESPIPGLFAAGDAAGNVLGYRYVGGGTSLGNAIVFGQIAGVSAARFASGT